MNAASIPPINLDGPELVKHITVQVKIHNWGIVVFRLKLMVWLLRFAAWVGGVGIEVEEVVEP